MNAKTLEALLGSIAKWQAIIAGTAEDYGRTNCPLCQMFWENDCDGCPVKKKTGLEDCDGSPYEKIDKAYKCGYKQPPPELAKAELEFLKSLLPARRPKKKSAPSPW